MLHFSNCYEIPDKLRENSVDVVLIDLDRCVSTRLIRDIRKKFPMLGIVGTATRSSADTIVSFLRAGGNGFINKLACPSQFSMGFSNLFRDEDYFDNKNGIDMVVICRRRSKGVRFFNNDLYPLEEKLIKCLWKDSTNIEIASLLKIQPEEALGLKFRVSQRLNLKGKDSLILWGIKKGVIELAERKLVVQARDKNGRFI